MITEIISLVVFVLSLAGFFGIIFKKMPRLEQIEASRARLDVQTANQEIGDWFKLKIKSLPYLRDFSWLDFAQKSLLKIKLVTLKAENKVNDYLVQLRQVADDERKKDEVRLDNYWRELKTIVKDKNPLYKRNSKTSVVETEAPVKEAVEKEDVLLKNVASVKTDGPEIKRVAMPLSSRDIERNSRKKRANSKKKNNRDPFQW